LSAVLQALQSAGSDNSADATELPFSDRLASLDPAKKPPFDMVNTQPYLNARLEHLTLMPATPGSAGPYGHKVSCTLVPETFD
jgi:hypothetical protein